MNVRHCRSARKKIRPRNLEKEPAVSSDLLGSQELSRFETSRPALTQQVRKWNATHTDYPRDRTVAQLFEEIASAFPGAIALVFGNVQLTYAELNARANRLAHCLRAAGVGPETLVGCCMDRSIELIVALLAILKAGGAYVPLDPEYPKERFNFLVQDTQTKVMLTQKSFASSILADYQQTCLLVDASRSSGPDPGNLTLAGGPKSLAYVMYTSGSTGQPKGVMVENRAIIRLVRNTNFCRFGADEVFLQFAPISFDASTLEIWGPLLNGGRLVVAPPQPTSLKDLGRVLREQNVTTLWLTAGLFNLVVEERLEDLQSVRQLLAGGDVLSPRHVRQALERLPNCRLINGYGPTENTTFTCCHTMHPGEPVPEPIPIGSPISNTQVYILDEQLRPVPPGTAGELYAAGDGLARGYLNNPETTNQKFLRNPFAADSDERIYRTGDLARWRSDGLIEFLGRADNQIKIHGHRVEPGEIEITLAAHERVKQTCVVSHPSGNGPMRLVAYYISSDSGLKEAELRSFLAGKLPEFMIPALFIPVKSLPLTPNGKVDRAALIALGMPARTDAAMGIAATRLEQTIIDIWRKSLGTDQFGVTDNFFDLGGDSLLLVGVHASLEKALQSVIPITDLFEFTTVQSLAHHLGGQISSGQSVSDAQQRARRQRAAFARQRERRIGSVT
jgi:amino acid adenylation domain-containing protein